GGLMARKDRKHDGTGASAAPITGEAGAEELGEFELPEDYAPSGDDWYGDQPTKKAKHFWPSAKRLIGLLAPEKGLFAFITALVIGSVVLMVIAPKVLGAAMDVIFNGVLGAQLP